MTSHDINTSNLRHLMEYYARKFAINETLVRDTLPDWINKAHSLRLKVVLREYHKQVIAQVKKWELFFAKEKIIPDGTTANRPMQDFLHETDARLRLSKNPAEMDAWLLASAKAVNVFMMNMYDMAAGFARSLELDNAAIAFEDAVANEKNVSEDLERVGKHDVNLTLIKPLHIA